MQFFAVPDDGEGVAADTAAGRLHDRQRDRRGDGGIHGVSALLQHTHPRLRRQRLGGGDGVMAHHRRAS